MSTYESIRSFFTAILSIYYNDMEVCGRANIPESGPIIIALNHVNSMADTAVSMSSLSPLVIRYTCKDTLLRDPKFGWLVRGAKSIGIQRKMDHKNKKVDNTSAFQQLFDELSKDCIVAMYPEGVGRYKPSLSPFRTGLARMAINFIIKNPTKTVNIVPVGLTYLHRDMFRSSVGVRIGKPIFLDMNILKEQKENLLQDLSDQNKDETKQNNDDVQFTADEIYKIGKNMTNTLTQRFSDLVISAPDWHTICLSHLARSIAFTESSSPKMGTYLTHYIDLTRQFNNVFVHNKQQKNVSSCYNQLSSYWNILWSHKLKDYRVGELAKYKNNGTSWLYKKCSYFARFLWRTSLSLVLYTISMPGVILSSPIWIIWRIMKRGRIKKGIEGSYDGLAMNKMFAITFGVPFFGMLYGFGVGYKYGLKNAFKFLAAYPLVLWTAVRAFQDATTNFKSTISLFKLLCMSSKTENSLIECRQNVSEMVDQIVNDYNIGYNDSIMNEIDKKESPLTRRSRMPWLYRQINGRIKNDWNETIRTYDYPSDVFHVRQS